MIFLCCGHYSDTWHGFTLLHSTATKSNQQSYSRRGTMTSRRKSKGRHSNRNQFSSRVLFSNGIASLGSGYRVRQEMRYSFYAHNSQCRIPPWDQYNRYHHFWNEDLSLSIYLCMRIYFHHQENLVDLYWRLMRRTTEHHNTTFSRSHFNKTVVQAII